jgi:hypothetical protein
MSSGAAYRFRRDRRSGLSPTDSTGLVCTSELRPMGRIAMPFDCTAWHTEAVTGDDGKLLLTLYGPEHYVVN